MEQKRRHLEIIGDVVEKFNNSIVSEVRVLLVVVQEKAIHTNYLIIGKPTHKHTNISQRKTDNQHCTRRVVARALRDVARALRDVLLAYQPKLEIHSSYLERDFNTTCDSAQENQAQCGPHQKNIFELIPYWHSIGLSKLTICS